MPKSKIAFIIVAFSLLIWLSIYSPPVLTEAKLSTISLFRFPLRAALSVSSRLRDFIGDRIYSKRIKENIALRKEIGRLANEAVGIKELEAENTRLKKLLDFKKEIKKDTIPARVIGMESALFSSTILIDRGAEDGIEPDMAVISREGVVGMVVGVAGRISRVMLLEDPDMRLGAIIQRTRERVLFVGGPRGKAKLIYLDADSDATEGDEVVSGSTKEIFPKGLLIGCIEKVEKKEGSLYKSASVRIAVDYSRLEEVLCVK